MRSRTAILFTAGLLAVQLFYALAAYSRVSAQGAQTVWDGIYTAEQAKRGEPLYSQGCMRCHGQDLMGGEMAPALSDGQFKSNFPIGRIALCRPSLRPNDVRCAPAPMH